MLRTCLKPHLKYAFTHCYRAFIKNFGTKRKKPTICNGVEDEVFFQKLLRKYVIVHPIIATRVARDERKLKALRRKSYKSIIVFWQ